MSSHTILLVQPTRKPEGRTYSDYESVNDCMEVSSVIWTFQTRELRVCARFTKNTWNDSIPALPRLRTISVRWVLYSQALLNLFLAFWLHRWALWPFHARVPEKFADLLALQQGLGQGKDLHSAPKPGWKSIRYSIPSFTFFTEILVVF